MAKPCGPQNETKRFLAYWPTSRIAIGSIKSADSTKQGAPHTPALAIFHHNPTQFIFSCVQNDLPRLLHTETEILWSLN